MSSALFTVAMLLGAVFIFIIIFLTLHKKRHNKKIERQKVIFADIVWKHKLEIIENESLNNCLLAMDQKNAIFLYINFIEPKEEVAIIDLWNIRTAKVTTEDNRIYEQRKGKNVLVDKQVIKLQLEVTLADNQKINLVLHQYKDGMQDFVHISKRAGYWSEFINNSIKQLPHPLREVRIHA